MVTKIVILNWNGRAHLERFLPSVVANSAEASVVVADNGSTDDSVAYLQTHFPQVELVSLNQNYGFAEGYNRALREVEADTYLLLNSDVEVPEGWLTPLIDHLKENPQTAILSPKIRSCERPTHFEYAGASGGFLDGFGYPFCRGRILKTLEEDFGQYDECREVFWASGACMLIRSEVFHHLGGFDREFFAHMEEIDLCWRAQLMGHKVMVEPASWVYHLGGGTLPNNSPRKLYLNYRNNLSMLYKNLSWSSLLPVMGMRTVLDTCSAFVFLLQGHVDLFKVVFRAHVDMHRQRKSLQKKRREIQRHRVIRHTRNVYRNSILLRYMLGKRTFGTLL